MKLEVSAERRYRMDMTGMNTGIYVRAVDEDGHWGSHDIAELTKQSLINWIEFKSEENPAHAMEVLLILLKHNV